MLWLFRLIFLLLMGYLGLVVEHAPIIGFAIGFVLVVIEYFLFEKLVKNLYSILFGLAIGMIIGLVLLQITESVLPRLTKEEYSRVPTPYDLFILVTSCYIGVAISLKYLARFKAVLPFIHVRQEMVGSNQVVVDTSALIDGRIVDLVCQHLLDYHLVIPKYVARELQNVADSADKTKRARGRLGLDNLKALKKSPSADIEMVDTDLPPRQNVDSALVTLARKRGAKLTTTDFNLNKFAQVEGVPVLNLNELANALKPSLLPGANIQIKIVKEGENKGQGVGYLPDGTMVVVENASRRIGQMMDTEIQSAIQTSAGKMLFAKPAE